jgi:hypothetical protein
VALTAYRTGRDVITLFYDPADPTNSAKRAHPVILRDEDGNYVGASGGFDDGDALDTDSQGTLLIGYEDTGTPGFAGGATARAVRVSGDGDMIVMAHADSFTFIDAAANAQNVWLDEDDATPVVNPAFGYVYNGATWDRLRGDTSGVYVGNTVATTGPAVNVQNALDFTAYDLNAAAFSETSAITDDYILDSVKLNFSTAESKTITVTGPDGTVLYQDTNTNQSVSLTDINIAFNASENFTVDVTQFGSAGTMDCIAVVRVSTTDLGGTATVTIAAVEDNFEIFEGTLTGNTDLDLNASALGRNATEATVYNDDSANAYTVAMSTDGATFGGAHTVLPGEAFEVSDVSIDTLRLTHTADAAYRVVFI